ncbi:hypothetical protein B0I35DRAFT_416308 [Stachybotrys elegans]|uniref:CCCH zinc finger and RRM domain-containing protein n=1 Tax=Stachybotrys elegans TaxID=80388 RepID=A0A8K0WWB7_9HYPO|nr:hypothetical protein B0I35DRAFT_416308 [Stachybotrys elegans]
MLFPEEDAPLLKAWIVKRIENTSDADSDVLAEYVIALLKHDGDIASVRKLCEQEIPDFLSEDPKAFLDDVFQAIAYKSYVPGAPPAPRLDPQSRPSDNAKQLQGSSGAKQPFPDNSSRKRGRDDTLNYDDGDFSHSDMGPRPSKNARRNQRRGDHRGGRRGDFPMGNIPMPQFDPNNPMEAIMQMQALAGLAKFPQSQQWGRNQPRRRARCRDFDTKGFCSRGSTCMFDHGAESVFMPSGMQPGEEYDPNDSVMLAGGPRNHGGQDFPMPFLPMFPNPGQGRGRGGGRKGRGGRKGGARAPFSAEGPVHDRSKSTIVVENIPEEHFSEEEVRRFFSEFGNIAEVSMQPYKHLAVVKYDTWTAANAAYRSPKVIFDNRFVKIFWYKDEADILPPSMPTNGSSSLEFNGSNADAEPELDPEEFERRQAEAQKQHQEREAKRLELEQKRQELEKQQQELLVKHREETERLRAKLREKNGGEEGAAASGTDALRAQLEALEQEAKILGIDPHAAEEAGPYTLSRGGHHSRGDYRGRGHTFRGRGGFVRGQAGRHAAYAQYSIDNRPKSIAITGVDFTAPDKDESLRHFLLNMGEFESVETTPTVTNVSFQDRKTAEKFYYTLHGKELPGVEGRLDLAWVKTAPGRATAQKDSSAQDDTRQYNGQSGTVEELDANGDEPMYTHEEPPPHQRQVDMDYEVADQDEW